MNILTIPSPMIGAAMFEQFKNIASTHDTKKPFVLCIPGGRSIVPFFSEWRAHMSQISTAFYDCLEVFLVDERRVAPDHDDSNMKLFMDTCGKALLEQGLLEKKQVHHYENNENDVVGSLEHYTHEFLRFSKHGSADLVILSSGEDGHVGALFPHHEAVQEQHRYFVALDDSPKPPAKRMTATPLLLSKARHTWLLFTGMAKQEAYDAFMDESYSIEDVPAKIVLDNEHVLIFTDLR